MGGLVIDMVVIFVAKIAMHQWRLFKGRKWPAVGAEITESDVQREYGYTNMHLAFRYRNTSGESDVADYYIPYWFEDSANRVCKRFRPGMQIRICANPSDSSQVIVQDARLVP